MTMWLGSATARPGYGRQVRMLLAIVLTGHIAHVLTALYRHQVRFTSLLPAFLFLSQKAL